MPSGARGKYASNVVPTPTSLRSQMYPPLCRTIPYVVLTLGLGSIGPLLYLVRRFGRDAVAVPHPHQDLTSRVAAVRA